MNATDSAFFQSLLDEIRRHMLGVPAEVVEGMRAVASEAFYGEEAGVILRVIA